MLKRALILSASAGAGHVRAADALEKAFQLRGSAGDIRHVDALDYTNKLFRKLYADAYLEMVNRAPALLGWLYDLLDKPGKDEKLRRAFNELNMRPIVRMLHDYKPDVAICTHFLPAEIISQLKLKGELSCPLAIVVTDLDVHAMWLCANYDRYFVAIEETKVHLQELGIDPLRITVSGIPIDPVFRAKKDKSAMWLKHGLEEDRVTFLVSAGGFGVGSVGHLLTALLRLQLPAQAVVVCGKNEKLRQELTSVAADNKDALKVVILGFTQEMDELMSAADIFIGKPGGLTTSEALAKGLAMVIVNPIPGQEERNSDHLLEEGVAIRCNNLPVLPHKLTQLIADPARLAAMRRKAELLGRPEAALTIVDTLTNLRLSPAA